MNSLKVVGLRETKKDATRRALAAATLRIVTDRGFEAATADAVSAEVGVSPRTFHNYFASKEDALSFYIEQIAERLLAALEEVTPGAPLIGAMEDALASIACSSGERPAELLTLLRLIETEPSMTAHCRGGQDEAGIDERFEALVARHVAASPVRDALYPRLVVNVGVVAARTALEVWTDRNPTGVQLRTVIRRAFAQLAFGLAAPPTADAAVPD
ncbi:TetR family transcriptional regulator [Williamsia sterculiae]|uniref:Transcriptional regulator, TetR family n=1 Tax=Williamsia sterculiae TaxID=1344003 RepID=A0A1N7F744_9NOCA|nr:TetR family transcriptional regulator [Williamsia sterculiae]SIR96157.1 transcriptional regulator, TetR family [Williamsia sterculiae]